jgi:DinB superfamily
MTVQEFMADQIERMAAGLASFIESTAPDRVSWRPEAPGGAETRSALEQAQECVAVNRYFAALLRGEQLDIPAGGVRGTPLEGVEDARKQLSESSAELAEAIRALSDAALAKTYSHWRGPASGAKLIIGAYRNMAYHAGQINLIQMLSGDAEFHMPATWY